ncbi:MAG: ABC-ATPase UvrA, partial [Parcubacteria group bacterium]|nr:ABC-ATPase UvrA [Parcubacteria group bacterium]
MEDKIVIKGARTHNLKNIDVEMPRNKMIAVTGLSGSGKSSLAFDTIFAEGQRRYVESLSAYARQFLRKLQKPDVDDIQGLSPAISVDQKSASGNPRSTVATITEIYDYLRVLYARVGKPHCLECGRPIQKLSNEEIKNLIIEEVRKIDLKKIAKNVLGIDYENFTVRIYAPVVVGRKGEYYQLLYDLLGKGYSEVKIDGVRKSLRERVELTKTKKHDIDVLVDELYLSEFRDDVASAEMRLSEAIERALNETDGLLKIDLPKTEDFKETHSRLISAKFVCPYDGFSFPEVEPRLFSFNSPYGACQTCNGLGTKFFFGTESCDECQGARLRKEALHVFLGGEKTNIVNVTAMTVLEANVFFKTLKLTKKEQEVSSTVVKEITDRLKFMEDVGIEYLTLNRRANTLSGGEAQRIRLASQLGSKLVGALYVLDEPTIGLHPEDNDRLVKTLHNLRDLGNTILVVEHDEDTVLSSDYIVDIGPGAGVHGGNVMVSAPMDEALTKPKKYKSLTLDYLRGDKKVPLPEKRRTADKGELKIKGANIFNIKNVDFTVPLGKLVAITGMSGSGKSTFLYEILDRNLRARFVREYRSANVYNCASFTGTEYLSRAILVDQSPIGRTPRSNPATYTGAFGPIRDLFAETEEARVRGWKPGRFSFNVPSSKGGGRCEACQGNGVIAVEMHFLPTVYVTCDICSGKRFQKETLQVRYKGKNIFQVLEMTVEEAMAFFEDVPNVYDRLRTLNDVGLAYLELGQQATTLSGGESQRVKISSELYRPNMQKTIYLLDEPTVGLHYADVELLVGILQELVNRGNTVVVIEHNMDV